MCIVSSPPRTMWTLEELKSLSSMDLTSIAQRLGMGDRELEDILGLPDAEKSREILRARIITLQNLRKQGL